jgi:hypothetical protein
MILLPTNDALSDSDLAMLLTSFLSRIKAGWSSITSFVFLLLGFLLNQLSVTEYDNRLIKKELVFKYLVWHSSRKLRA